MSSTKTQPTFKFSPEQIADIRTAIQGYFLDELEMEIGDLQADLFIDFLNEKIGKKYYNLGVVEAIQAIKEKTDDLALLVRE